MTGELKGEVKSERSSIDVGDVADLKRQLDAALAKLTAQRRQATLDIAEAYSAAEKAELDKLALEKTLAETVARHATEVRQHQDRRKEASGLIGRQRDKLAQQAEEMARLQRAYLRRSPRWWLIQLRRKLTGKRPG